MSRGRRALQIPFAHAAALRECAALRVFQITGVAVTRWTPPPETRIVISDSPGTTPGARITTRTG
jgi:hypothetical protein